MDDLISRQAAIDTLWEIRREEVINGRRFENHCSLSTAVDVIRDLPSAQPELAQDLHNACTDAINRQAAIDAVRAYLSDCCVEDGDYHASGIEYELNDLPSAQPERKTGKWTEKEVIHIDDLEAKDIITEWQSAKCNVCGKYHTTPYMYYFNNYEYCPNCGADMRGEQDE